MTDLFSEYELAAKNNDSDAQFELAKIFKQGKLVDKDLEKSFYWLTKSAENGNQKARHNLGNLYLQGLEGVAEIDTKKGVELHISAAESGFSPSQVTLGVLYADGGMLYADDHDGALKQDVKKSVDWLTKAAENQNDEAKFLFAMMYFKNTEIITDMGKVYRWLSESAENDHKKSQELLGLRYMDGDQYLTKDTEQGNKWLTKARSNGDSDTLQSLASDYEQGAHLHKYGMINETDSEISPKMRLRAMKNLSDLDRENNKWVVYSREDHKSVTSNFNNVKQLLANDSVVSIAVFSKDKEFIKEFTHRDMTKRDLAKRDEFVIFSDINNPPWQKVNNVNLSPKDSHMKNLIALIVLIAMGVSFIAAIFSLFNGVFLGAIGLFILSAVLNGVAKALKA